MVLFSLLSPPQSPQSDGCALVPVVCPACALPVLGGGLSQRSSYGSLAYTPGSSVTVTIVGPDYRGVLLEARAPGDTTALGTWQLPPPDTRFLEVSQERHSSIKVFGNPQGAITHSNTNIKGNSTVFSWTAPTPLDPSTSWPPSLSRGLFTGSTSGPVQSSESDLSCSLSSPAKGADLGLASGSEGVNSGGTLLFTALCWLLCKTLI
ncbi:hypothetical protein WMY93_004687 [Mugilogobius chulae]|uniref:Reelin domain-containing protein n=1 Tax=Mugilogobius chulae TaxID=88201 RepID=A0AAW0PZZ6_9GOBI